MSASQKSLHLAALLNWAALLTAEGNSLGGLLADYGKHWQAELDSANVEIQRLRGWLEGDAECPCCRQTKVCADDCTLIADDQTAVARMLWTRHVLEGA